MLPQGHQRHVRGRHTVYPLAPRYELRSIMNPNFVVFVTPPVGAIGNLPNRNQNNLSSTPSANQLITTRPLAHRYELCSTMHPNIVGFGGAPVANQLFTTRGAVVNLPNRNQNGLSSTPSVNQLVTTRNQDGNRASSTPDANLTTRIGANPQANLLGLPNEILLKVTSHLYPAERQAYFFTCHYKDPLDPDKRTWVLHVRDVVNPFQSPNLPRRFGSRILFPIRVLAPEGAHFSRTALKATHSHFNDVMKIQLPRVMVDKPVEPEEVEVWDETWFKTVSGLDHMGEYVEALVAKPASRLPGKYFLKEKRFDPGNNGWGVVWKEGRAECEWPVDVPRVGVPEPGN